MKLAIIGSRDCPQIDIMAHLKHLPTEVISGGARGADTYAREFAHKYNLPLTEYLPDYDKYGKNAPLVRNKLIVENCDCLIAFWDGKSRGTKLTLDYAKERGKKVKIVLLHTHIGYIAQITQDNKFGVLIDSKRKAHCFELQAKDKFVNHQFVTYCGELSVVTNVTPLESYPINSHYCYEAFYIQEGLGSSACWLVDTNGNRYELDGAEAYVVNRLIEKKPIIPQEINKYTFEEYNSQVLEVLNKVEYVCSHLQEIADSYTVKYRTRHIPKVGGDDRFYVDRDVEIVYRDTYLANFFLPDEQVFRDSGYTSHFDIPTWLEEEMNTCKELQEEAKLKFIKEYDKGTHISTLLYELETAKAEERDKEVKELLEFYSFWAIGYENVGVSVYNSLWKYPIIRVEVQNLAEVKQIIEDFNIKGTIYYKGNTLDQEEK